MKQKYFSNMQCGSQSPWTGHARRCFPEFGFVILHLCDDFANFQAKHFTHFRLVAILNLILILVCMVNFNI